MKKYPRCGPCKSPTTPHSLHRRVVYLLQKFYDSLRHVLGVFLRDLEIIMSFQLSLPEGRRHKSTVQYATRPDLPKLAYRRVKGKSPGVVFLPGYGSNMNGQKAEALEEFCRSLGHSYLRYVIRNNVETACRCNVSGFHA